MGREDLETERDEKTKPISSQGVTDSSVATRELSSRQLAAIRLLATGYRPGDVAAELGMTRQGLWKWRRMPLFNRELQQTHRQLREALAAGQKASF